MRGASHRDTGVLALLSRAAFYRLVQRLLLRSSTRQRVVRDIIRPYPGCRILDIGCGPADILEHLPEDIGAYHGFDMNPRYIEAARRRWGAGAAISNASGWTKRPRRRRGFTTSCWPPGYCTISTTGKRAG